MIFQFKSVSLSIYLSLSVLVVPLISSMHVAAAERGAMLEEVVVTARKREESLNDTPISITAFTSEEIEARGLSDVSQITQVTPNLVFDAASNISGSNSGATIFLRGVGQLDFTLNADPGVGLYVDGVYVSRSVGGLLDLVDVERIEVLRGPQGTLFGRNTIGGAVSITTKNPHTEQFEADFKATVGRFDRVDGYLNLNIPMGDTLAARVSVASRNRDSIMDRPIDGRDQGNIDSLAGRLKVLWAPTDAFSAVFAFDATKKREGSAQLTLLDTGPGLGGLANALSPNPCDVGADPDCYWAPYLTGDEYTNFSNSKSQSDLDVYGVNLTLDYDINENLSLRSITSYRNQEITAYVDLDLQPNVIFEAFQPIETDDFAQEIQLLGTSFNDKLDWIVGAYYEEEDGDFLERLFFIVIPEFQSGGFNTIETKAVFAQGTYHITDKLKLTLGGRYTKDDRDFKPDQYVIQEQPGIGPPVGLRFLPKETFNKSISRFTPLANLAYHFTDDFMAYATLSTGFKSGGFSQRYSFAASAPDDFGPEFVDSFELGFKWSDPNGSFQLSGAAFYNEYEEIHVLVDNPNGPGGIFQNGGEAEIKGLELEGVWLPAENWRVSGGLGVLDAKYTEINPGALDIQKGFDLPKAPEVTANVSVSYDFDLNGATLTPRLDWSYRDEVKNDAANKDVIAQDSYDLLNASLNFVSADEKYSIILAGQNLSDERYLIAGEDTLNNVYGTYALPRTWSLTFKYSIK